LRLFVTSILAEEPWKFDSKVIPIPWRPSEEDAIRSKLSSGGLTLAYYSSNGVVSMPRY
jgi:amidase